MNNHTPGPWLYYKNDFTGGFTLRDSINRLIGSTSSPSGVDARLGSPYTRYGCEANARLIAAAPELLEALEDVREWISNWDPNFTHDPEWQESATRIDVAIAKAKGKPNA